MRKAKLLLVDDSKVVLMAERVLLRSLGEFELAYASNGREAIEAARAEQPDLILMDVVMPEMNGFEACRALRSEAATRHIPIILVTTRSEGDNVAQGYESGCNDYITKPIDKAELAQKLTDLLGDEA